MIAVGRIGRLFGTDGGVMITLYGSFPDDFRKEEPLFVEIDKLAVPLFCSEWERRVSRALWLASMISTQSVVARLPGWVAIDF